MVPHNVMQTPMGLEQRVPWQHATAQLKLEEIRAEVIEELRAEDRTKARRAGLAVANDEILSSLKLETNDDDGGGKYVINPLAANCVHTGAETTDRLRDRWLEFCAKPQDESVAQKPAVYAKKVKQPETVNSPVVVDTAPPEKPKLRRKGTFKDL